MNPEIATTCPYCGVGCGVLAQLDDNGQLQVRGDPDHPANQGRLCSKGSALAETIGLNGRLLHPQINNQQVGWDEALNQVASGFSGTIAQYGPDSVAFYVSGQLLTEDYYVANKLMKGYIGSANIDTNSRLCMASSVAGHRRAFGSDTVPGTYQDLELADLIVLVGSNLAWCHPILYQRIAAEKQQRPELKVVLIDPRKTRTVELADMHLAIRADSDSALFNGLLARLTNSEALNRSYIATHTQDFASALAVAKALSSDQIAQQTGLSHRELEDFYQLFIATDKTVTVYSQGVNQSSGGTDKVNAIINCHLATGRIGRPGTGPFSVTGQPNAMGGREVGGLANMLACHMDIERPDHRELVQKFWQAPSIAERPGLKAVDLFRAVGAGRIKALWIMATNPVDSLPEADIVQAALKACPLVVVSDVSSDTDTVQHAHIKLPAAAWGEKFGTVTNSERMISRQRALLPLPGEARPDWWIITEVARRMGFADAFNYTSAAEIFAEYAALSATANNGSRDFDIGAFQDITEADYENLQPFRWPKPASYQPIQERFFANGGFYTRDRKARFIAVNSSITEEIVAKYPFRLNSGRVRDQWHTMTRTGLSQRLSAHLAEPFVEIHPQDAHLSGIQAADLVQIHSVHGDVILRALLSERQTRGTVFVPMHWNDQFAARARVNTLVTGNTDPVSGQPALKAMPVSIQRFAAAAFAFAILRDKPDNITADYWALAKCNGGWRLEMAFTESQQDWSRLLPGLCNVPSDQAGILDYHDGKAQQYRAALFDSEQKVQGALFIAPEPVAVARTWVVEQLSAEPQQPQKRFSVIAGRGSGAQPDKGAIVCSCFSVGINEITDAINNNGCHDVAAIGKALQAGTNCGSCRAELNGIINQHSAVFVSLPAK